MNNHFKDSQRDDMFDPPRWYDLFAQLHCVHCNPLPTFKEFFRTLNATDRSFFSDNIKCSVFVQKFYHSEYPQLYALIGGIDPIYAQEIEKMWRLRIGHADIEVCNPTDPSAVFRTMQKEVLAGILVDHGTFEIVSDLSKSGKNTWTQVRLDSFFIKKKEV
jgi:hypothetical protein